MPDRRLRVLRLAPEADWRVGDPPAAADDAGSIGGLAVQVLAQARATAALGVDQTVLAVPPAQGPREAALGGSLRLRGAGRPGAPGVHRRNLAWLMSVLVRLRAEGRRHDVVHVHASGIVEPLLAALAARVVTRRPLVMTLHCSAQVTYTPHSRRDAVVQLLTRAAERAAVRASARTFVLTRRAADVLGSERIEVLPDGVDVAAFAARDDPGPAATGRAPEALFVGRVSREKGWPALVDLAERLSGRGLRVRVCGDGPDLAALAAEAARRGVRPAFTLEGACSHAAVAAAMAAADVLVLPSEHEELGSVLIEAMAAGLPVVATDVGGVAEAVVAGQTGLLVAPGDPGALAAAVERVLDDEELRRAARKTGPRIARERFDVEAIGRRLHAVYGEVAGVRPAGTMRVAVLVDQFPALSETFVLNEILALARIGHRVHVETAAWATPAMQVPDGLAVTCLDDDGQSRRAADLAWLMARHPARCAADLWQRRRWSREERVRPLRVIAPLARRVARRADEHLHVHFAAGMALDALRLGRLLGLPYSVTAHAYDIYRSPRNLREKLESAAVATGVSEYSVRDLRDAVSPAARAHVHVVPMGVDHERFRRELPYPGGRHVVAIGRLVEKKGFAHLLAGAALLRDSAPLDRLTIIGDGPLRSALEQRATELGLGDVVTFTGPLPASGVRRALLAADLVVISAVPVDDGDRDVLPMVAGEALAMEVPVVASDFVGLPEVIRPPWGRLVPPGDVEALAAAMQDVLGRPADERAGMGRQGREFVVATRDLDQAARRLTELIRAAAR